MAIDIALNTLAFQGYTWQTALEETANLGVAFIEPVYIAKYDPTLQENFFSAKQANIVLRGIEDHGLKVRSVASHMDMGLTDSVDVFSKRMEFAKTLGAQFILTNSSSTKNRNRFFANMETLSRGAADLQLTIALENPGDGQDYIINDATEGSAVVRELESQWVKLNYDFSNIHTLSKGDASCDAGLGEAMPAIAHLHIKNVRKQGDWWRICALADGIVDYRKFFRAFPALTRIPMSVELPARFGYDPQFHFVAQDARPSLENIRQLLRESVLFLNSVV